jgi:electron transport complex protein RnfA
MGLATTFVMTLASACSYLMEHYILIPLDIAYLRTLGFILVIAVVVQFTEMVIRKSSPTLYRLLGIFLPSSPPTAPCSGGAAQHQRAPQLHPEHHLRLRRRGFSLVLILFAAMRERLVAADVPAPFRGVSIAMVTAGLMSLAFMGFTGLIKI